MKRVYIVYCHPRPDSLIHAALQRVLAGLTDHEVRVSDLYADGFRAEMSLDERRTHKDPPHGKAGIAAYADNLRWCTTVVFVYPTWYSSPPAMLKGWLDRVLVQGVAWTLPEGKRRIRPALKNIRSITVVTTHGSSKLVNAVQGEAGKRMIFRAFRALCHPLARCRWVALYGVDRSAPDKREAFLGRVQRSMRRV